MAAKTVYQSAFLTLPLFLFVAWPAAAENAEVGAKPKADLPVIADQPKTVDPATLMPDSLTKQAT
ncbi:MAG: hypothetical protein ACODAD_15000 [Planctomycetota bacterium]